MKVAADVVGPTFRPKRSPGTAKAPFREAVAIALTKQVWEKKRSSLLLTVSTTPAFGCLVSAFFFFFFFLCVCVCVCVCVFFFASGDVIFGLWGSICASAKRSLPLPLRTEKGTSAIIYLV